MHDVARACGVSQALVSIVMRGAPGASKTTRERVLQTASELGYRRDERARRLRQRAPYLIGVVFNPLLPEFGHLIGHLQTSATTRGYSTALRARLGDDPLEPAIDAMAGDRVDTLLLLGPIPAETSLEPTLRSIPMIRVVINDSDSTSADSAPLDNSLLPDTPDPQVTNLPPDHANAAEAILDLVARRLSQHEGKPLPHLIQLQNAPNLGLRSISTT